MKTEASPPPRTESQRPTTSAAKSEEEKKALAKQPLDLFANLLTDVELSSEDLSIGVPLTKEPRDLDDLEDRAVTDPTSLLAMLHTQEQIKQLQTDIKAPASSGGRYATHRQLGLASETAMLQQRGGASAPGGQSPQTPAGETSVRPETQALQTQGLQSAVLSDPESMVRATANANIVGQMPDTAASATNNSANWSQAVAAATATLVTSGGKQQPSGDGQSPNGSPQGRVWLDQPGATNGADAPQDGQAPDFAARLGEALTDAYEALGTQVSLWAGSQTKRASMRVDLGQDNPLDVDVALDDGKATLAFRTDDTQVREQLRTQAHTVLADLLARSGIGLDGISVGAHGPGDQGRGTPQDRPTARVQFNLGPEPAPLPSQAGGQRGNGRLGLDVYA